MLLGWIDFINPLLFYSSGTFFMYLQNCTIPILIIFHAFSAEDLLQLNVFR